MKLRYNLLLISCVLLCDLGKVCSQGTNDGTVNNDGGIIDNHPLWINSVDGAYFGTNNGVFNHFGSGNNTFINHGVYQATLGHKDVFKGPDSQSGDQEIGGTKAPDFFDLEFSNGATSFIHVTNTQGVTVAGTLNFQNGITTTERILNHAGAIRITSGGSYLNGNSDTQHVNGYVSKIGNGVFKFPVGSATDFRSVEITAPGNESAHFSVAWIAGDPGLTSDPSDVSQYHPVTSKKGVITSVSKLGQWDWITVVPSTTPLTVKVSIPDLSAFGSSASLRLVGWDGTGWIDLSGASTASGNTENSILQGVIPANSAISAVGLGSSAPALPVTLISFNAVVSEKTNTLLNWSTSSETNNDYFEVQYSPDARDFKPIGQVKSKGTFVATNADYTFLHHLNLPSGINYYRLKQVDTDGSFSYSTIRSVDFGALLTRIYPNPSSDKIHVEVQDWAEMKSVELLDNSGKVVFASFEKRPIHVIDIRLLPISVYIVKIQYNQGIVVTQKIIVTK